MFVVRFAKRLIRAKKSLDGVIKCSQCGMFVHIVIGDERIVVDLEWLRGFDRASEVSEGTYFLNAAPLNLSGADGSPCRAILIVAER